jgi:hypothetical protein
LQQDCLKFATYFTHARKKFRKALLTRSYVFPSLDFKPWLKNAAAVILFIELVVASEG